EALDQWRADADRSPRQRDVVARRRGEIRSWRNAPFALSDVRVVDLSWLLASGGAGRFLAALGAEVIKIEHHSRPDHGRNSWVGRVPLAPAELPGSGSDPLNRSGSFMEINAGKLSVSLDLKQQEGLELVLELVAGADAVINGFSPGT